jgi:hypothetical protein
MGEQPRASDRRDFIRKLAAGTAFVAPLVASFSTKGLRFNEAEALPAGGNAVVPEPASLALLATGVAGVAAAVGLRRKKPKSDDK